MVLREVLACIIEKGYIRAEEISRELCIPIGFVEYALHKLKDREYLLSVLPRCEQVSCRFCPFSSACKTKTAGLGKFYTLTEKGKKLLT